MVFGEIVEPTTRALILDDELELPQYEEPVFQWQGNQELPNDIEQLIFLDSAKVIQVCAKITKSTQPILKLLNEGLSIYQFGKSYLVVFNGESKNLVIGQIVEALSPWIQKAKNIHGITSRLVSTYQSSESLINTSLLTFTKCLTNHDTVPFKFCDRLEAPNLIQGFSASAFTYCIHSNFKASLWVVFTDDMPLDSVNSSEILKLLNVLGFEVRIDFKADAMSSNLYM